jgi:hypothetical protein
MPDKIENEELLTEAEELEIEVDDHKDEESLQKAVDEKKAELEKKKEKDADPEFWKSEAKSAFEIRDKAKKENRTLKNKIKNLEEKLDNTVDKDKVDELQEQLDTLLEEKKKREDEEEEKRLEKADEAERVKIQEKKKRDALESDFDKKMKDFEEKFNKATERLETQSKEIVTLRRAKLSNEIRDYAAEGGAYNPRQIDKLLSADAEYDKDTDSFYFPVYDEKGKLTDELSVKEKVKEFLEDPDNDNLVESKVNKGGTGHKKAEMGKPSEKKPKPGEYDPKDPDIIKEAERRDMKPETLISIWTKRDEKKKKIEENRKERNRLRSNSRL